MNLAGNTTLSGKGKVTLQPPNTGGTDAFIQGNSFTLTNTNNIIQGAGVIGNGNLSLVNGSAGTIFANSSGQTLLLNASGTITNNGTFKVASGATLHVTNGTFANFSGGTLTGGTYNTAGILQIDELGTGGGEIVTNSAKITLSGAAAQIVNQSDVNALPNLETVTSKGAVTVTAGQQFTTTLNGNFSNAGIVMVGKHSSFKVACNTNFQCPYVQTAGTTTVDGTLTDSLYGVQIQGGKLFGTGTIAATVTSSGAVTAGDAVTKAGVLLPGAYVQNAKGSLNIQIGGTTVGTQYSQLAAGNGVSLSGTLNIHLINGFVPAISDTFTIIAGSAVTGTFATVNGLSINSSEHFEIAYNGTNVTLTVVSGA